MAPETLGLRERKKLRTRETIAEVALRLFDEKGYDETTIAAIAAAADVAPRTVSGYFPTKEDIVFSEGEEAFAELAERLDRRPAGEMAPEALRAWIKDLMEDWREMRETHCMKHRVIESDESLRARRQLQLAHVQDLLTDAIAVDIGAEPGALHARMAAASTMAIIETLGDYLVEPKETDPTVGDDEFDEAEAEVLELLDRAVVFVGAGIEAMREES